MTPHELYVMDIMESRGIDRRMMLDSLGIVSTHRPGHQKRSGRPLSASEEDVAARLRMSGRSYEFIGRALNRCADTVRTHLERVGL
jgi:DNA-binding NarL/FixJ family response regulator